MIRAALAKQRLRERALQLGFADMRVVGADFASDYPHLCDWLDRGYAGSMHYLNDRREAYAHPRSILEGCRSLLMLATSYLPHEDTGCSKSRRREPAWRPHREPAADVRIPGSIAAYARGQRDYHDVLHERMRVLIAELHRMEPEGRARGVVDTAPLLERNFARRAGLGWTGKNTLLLHPKLGSYFFLSAIVTSVELEPDDAFLMDHCGTCRACLDACPTDAFVEPRVLDATRCISYWTIEHRGSIPEEWRPALGEWLFGCDACQIVCPWNRKSPREVDSEWFADDRDEKTDCVFWLRMDESAFRERFRGTAFWRTRLTGMQRNAMIVAVNLGRKDALPWIRPFLESTDPDLRELASWCLGRLNPDGRWYNEMSGHGGNSEEQDSFEGAAMASTTLPVSIEKTEHRSLTIRWDDGKRFDYPYAALRNACPCASCRERKKADENRPRGSLNILKPAETVELDILQMRPVGNYAYNIVFSDGHSSGLFTMELLRELGMALGKDSPVPPHASSSTDTPPGP